MALYDDAVAVASLYLGPAAKGFLSRQLNTLSIDVQALGREHLEKLAERCLVSGKVFMDEAKATTFSQKIRAL